MSTSTHPHPCDLHYPSWRDWDNVNYTIACGGNEIPSLTNGNWYLMVLNLKENRYYHYNFNQDIFYTEKEFAEQLAFHVEGIQKGINFAGKWNEKSN
tara:strand:- start:28 stop:318 length:291 start_codon:yes stop_codon:yes gene_type:complete